MEEKYPERYTVLVKKSMLETWEQDVPDFTILNKADIWYGDDLVVLKITPKTKDGGFTVEDVFDLTDALMAHEEYTNGFFTDEDCIKELADYYAWDSAAWTLVGDMLTEGEKIHILITQFDLLTGERPLIKDIEFSTNTQKDHVKEYKPIIGNVKELFGDNITWFRFCPKDGAPAEINGWWATLVSECGLFIVILDFDKQVEDEEEEAMDIWRKTEPYWDSDYYDYIDEWYDKHGGMYY